MHVAIIGAGSIGCYVGGRLMHGGGVEVTLVGRRRFGEEIERWGLRAEGLDQTPAVIPADMVRYERAASAAKDADVALVCVKSAQTEEVARDLSEALPASTLVVSLQNGVDNPRVLGVHLGRDRVVAGIVGFNVVARSDGVFHRGMDGPIALERNPHEAFSPLVEALLRADVPVEVYDDLRPQQWTKLLVNLNNSISALSGAPTRELLMNGGYRRVVADVIAEGIAVLRAADVRPARLRGVPVGLMPHVLRLPDALARLVLAAQMKVDPQARSSMWEDLTRGRKTEVEYLNGALVRLAATNGAEAPLNARIVELIHEAEEDGAGPPNLDPMTLRRVLENT